MNISVEEIPIKRMTSVDTHHLKVLHIDSGVPGPHVHIQASVHGAEIQGNAVIFELLRLLKSGLQFQGSLTVIPMANPMGINHKAGSYTAGRHNPISGNNWNRNYHDFVKLSSEFAEGDQDVLNLGGFLEDKVQMDWTELKKTYRKLMLSVIDQRLKRAAEYGISDDSLLALNLQKLAIPADFVLDLHTGGVCAKYLYTPEYCLQSAKNLGFAFNLIIPEEFAGAMDEASFVPWVKLRQELANFGREVELDFEAYTLELGSQEMICIDEARRDLSGILKFLRAKGMIHDHAYHMLETAPTQSQYGCRLADFKSYYAKTGGLAQYHIMPGDFLKRGDLMASIIDFEPLSASLDMEACLHEIRCIKDCIFISGPISGAISQGMDLFTVMENYFKL